MKKLIILIVVIIVLGALYTFLTRQRAIDESVVVIDEATENSLAGDSQQSEDSAVVEFHLRSFVDNQSRPQFSEKELVVHQGDLVKINILTESGSHDFKIDEFNVHAATPTGQTTRVEFVADQVGEFIYYCNMPGHRANGHWGTLIVLEAKG